MCGIFGVINGSKYRTSRMTICNFVKDAFTTGSIRGEDSTGMMQRGKNNKVLYHKLPVNGSIFNKDPITKGLIFDVDTSSFTVCHNRAATAGVVSMENAHPFTHFDEDKGCVTGVHNGTLQDWKDFESSDGMLVDSDWAMKMLLNEGHDAFEYFRGAYCFVWYDDRFPEQLHFARNSDRPMYFAYEKGKDTMVFASEPGMLSWIAERNRIEIDASIYELDKSQIYTFSLANPREFTKKATPSIVNSHFKPKKYSAYNAHTGWNNQSRKDFIASGMGGTMYDDDDSWEWGSRRGMSSQELFLLEMEEALTGVVSKVKKSVTKKDKSPLNEAINEQLMLAMLEPEESPDEEKEREEAILWGINGTDITVFPISYNPVTKIVSWDISTLDGILPDDAGILNDVEYIKSRGVSEEAYKDIRRVSSQKVKIVGAYYDDDAPTGVSIIVTNDRMESAKFLNKKVG